MPIRDKKGDGNMKDKLQTLKALKEYATNMHNWDDVEALDWAISKLEKITNDGE